ncbi:DUF2231 domain-containing protein [Daejeonella lutea]|uniref:Uncharacterized membrane protein n=1 Tax=Daejeonella lutea TaxID=572036 RepID=A0A1T5BN45_9SPHI|nr:DUF2231 domain-containing protein [Daejeonella lutea]SKB48696.1 Uncharacterized membrane protein [Daejeonella lutea]
MDLTHLHLLITHLPIVGTLLGTFVLIYGLYTDSHSTVIASYWVLVISSIGGVIAYLTGESAEEVAEHLQGVSEQVIKTHEEAAELALISLAILGLLALIGVVFNARLIAYKRTLSIFILVFSIISFALVARTGYFGGMIRHSEVNQALHDS